MKKIFLILFSFSFFNFYPQSKLEKWGKKEINYTIPVKSEQRNYSFSGDNAGEVVAKAFINVYWFTISDEDGDTCPFYPSCSSFFIQSVKETNLFQGSLMFADRFMRDINFVNRAQKYPLHQSGKFYDPPSLYTLK